LYYYVLNASHAIYTKIGEARGGRKVGDKSKIGEKSPKVQVSGRIRVIVQFVKQQGGLRVIPDHKSGSLPCESKRKEDAGSSRRREDVRQESFGGEDARGKSWLRKHEPKANSKKIESQTVEYQSTSGTATGNLEDLRSTTT
jgi:hypothetical protein